MRQRGHGRAGSSKINFKEEGGDPEHLNVLKNTDNHIRVMQLASWQLLQFASRNAATYDKTKLFSSNARKILTDQHS